MQHTSYIILLQVVSWMEDGPCSREWLLENIKGASGILCSATEKVLYRPSFRSLFDIQCFFGQINAELLDTGIKSCL